MSPKLYYFTPSPPSRAVRMAAKALGVKLELIETNPFKREQMVPEYLKINPQHSIPTLIDDDGFIIWDSHAIMVYLVSKYGKDDSLYPKDLKKRAVVDQRLFFEASIAFARVLSSLATAFRNNKKTIESYEKDGIIEAYDFLNKFLENKQWVTGDTLTIADFSLISSISSLNVLVPIDKEKFPLVIAWLKKAEALPVYDVNKEGLEVFTSILKDRLEI